MPDPRIAGAQIIFDSRLDVKPENPFMNSVKQQSNSKPSFIRTQKNQENELKEDFRRDAEALYDPRDHGEFVGCIDRERYRRLENTVEKYNLIISHVNR